MAQNGRKTRAECEKLGLSTKWVGSGRPRHTPLTEQQLKKIAELLEYGMTVEDCAILCGISKDTLENHYREHLDVGMANRRQYILKEMFRIMRETDNAKIAIHLAQQYCGHTTKIQTEITGANGGPIEYKNTTIAEMSNDELDRAIADAEARKAAQDLSQ